MTPMNLATAAAYHIWAQRNGSDTPESRQAAKLLADEMANRMLGKAKLRDIVAIIIQHQELTASADADQEGQTAIRLAEPVSPPEDLEVRIAK